MLVSLLHSLLLCDKMYEMRPVAAKCIHPAVLFFLPMEDI